MPMWQVPPIWAGQTVAILASGRSMSAEVVQQLGAIPMIAINDTVALAPRASMLYAADRLWWVHPTKQRLIRDFEGLRVTIWREGDGPVPPGCLALRGTGVVGFDPDPACIRTGGNSAYQALHIAVHAGASRILLAGLDLTLGHWHPEHPAPLGQTCEIALARWRERFEQLAGILRDRVEIINVSERSTLRCWPKMAIEDALRPRAAA